MKKLDWLACVPFPLGVVMVATNLFMPIDDWWGWFTTTAGVLLIIAGIIIPSKIRAYIWGIVELILNSP